MLACRLRLTVRLILRAPATRVLTRRRLPHHAAIGSSPPRVTKDPNRDAVVKCTYYRRPFRGQETRTEAEGAAALALARCSERTWARIWTWTSRQARQAQTRSRARRLQSRSSRGPGRGAGRRRQNIQTHVEVAEGRQLVIIKRRVYVAGRPEQARAECTIGDPASR